MFRLSGLCSIVIATLCGTLLFLTSQSVQRAEKNLFETSQSVLNEKESLRVLSAEWDYLNRPERLEALTRDNLDMNEVHVEEKNFLNHVRQIPEPIIPAVPRAKPGNLMHHISMNRKDIKKSESSSAIQKTETENFDQLLDVLQMEDRQ